MNETIARNAYPVYGQDIHIDGESDRSRKTRELLQRYARRNGPVLIEGETDDDKKLAARAIHYAHALENLILRLCMHSDERVSSLAELMAAAPSISTTSGATHAARHNGAAPSTDQPERSDEPLADAGIEANHGSTQHEDTRFITAKRRAIESFEHDYLTELMRRTGGNISRAALVSGTERRQLGKMLKRHGIARRRYEKT